MRRAVDLFHSLSLDQKWALIYIGIGLTGIILNLFHIGIKLWTITW